jgi:hypothetical protein
MLDDWQINTSIIAAPKTLGRPKGSRDSKPRQMKQSRLQVEPQRDIIPIDPSPSRSAGMDQIDQIADHDIDPIADHTMVRIEYAIQAVTVLQIFESEFDAEAAYSIEDDPFHYDWVFW